MARQAGLSAIVAVLLVALAPAGAARAAFGFAPGSPAIQVLNAAGEPYALAGGHPDRIVVSLGFNVNADRLEGNAKEISVDFPPGLSGNLGAVAACPRPVFERSAFGDGKCDPASQVGVARFTASQFGTFSGPVYNVEPAPGQPAALGATVVGKFSISLRLRPDDLGLSFALSQLPQPVAVTESEIELWGVPADHQAGPASERRPFVTLPPRCDRGPLAITARARSWQEPEHWITVGASTGVPLTGCDSLPFAPAIAFSLTSPAADTPSGANLDLTMPQSEDPDERASAALRGLEATLPAGISISPGAMDELVACTDVELGLGEERAASCPPASRVGDLELDAPQLAAPLLGGIYLGAERPDERFRLFLIAQDDGISAKFVGALHPEPATGRTRVAFDDIPELGFRQIRMRFDSGPGALLATPLSCGKLTATAIFERYDNLPSVAASSVSEIISGANGGACLQPPPFSPRFVGGTTSAKAGHRSGLSMTLSRDSGEQLIRRFEVTVPRGLSIGFSSLSRCSDQAVRDAACPAASRIGSAVVAIGSGESLATLTGDIYLTGSYRRAPFGLALIFPARIGGFDMGTIAVRAAFQVDPESGRVSVQSDSLPDAIEGVPIRFRTVGLDIDRPGLVRTPTSCAPAAFEAEVHSTSGASALVSAPFQIRGCDSLPFSPRLSVALTGRRQMHRGGHPEMRIAIRARSGDTNLRGVDLGMPKALQRDLGGLRALCARDDARDGICSPDARIGRARGITPLFERPLLGSVYLVRPRDDGPPELWATLDAEGVRLSVRGGIFSSGGRVHARFADLPDVPLSKLVLSLDGGARGLLSLRSDPCGPTARPQRAKSALEGQNGGYIIRGKVVHLDCAGSSGGARAATRAPVRRG